MSTLESIPAQPWVLRDPGLKERIQELRRTDNWTNWLYVGRAWLIIASAVGGAVWFDLWRQANAVSVWWDVPVFLLAVIVIGASQHQLAGATHEATHHILFSNRLLNELASDWLCMFPLFSSTYVFRLHHLAHHQFVNDPGRDPDFAQLRASGHGVDFPLDRQQFFGMLRRQLTLVPLIRYILVRAKYNSLGVESNPYHDPERKSSPWPNRLAVMYLFGLLGSMTWATYAGPTYLLAVLPVAGLALVTAVLMAIPADRYFVTRLRPVISPRATMISRMMFVTALFAGLAWTQRLTGAPAWVYFFTLWLGALLTSFPFFMMLRQLVQHGNGDRGRLTNTRTFLVNPFARYAVFPFGMDYHLPHHLFATIPHYRLPELHEVLRRSPEYAGQGIVVEGYFRPPREVPDRNPTVVEVLGREYHRSGDEVYIDHAALEGSQFDDASPAISTARPTSSRPIANT